jgi:hypothetical protein
MRAWVGGLVWPGYKVLPVVRIDGGERVRESESESEKERWSYRGFDMVQSHAAGQSPLGEEAQLGDDTFIDLLDEVVIVSVIV